MTHQLSHATLSEETVRAAYHHFCKEAQYPCSPSAMREAIDLAVGRMAPEQADVVKLIEALRAADFAWITDNRVQTAAVCEQAASMIERLLAGAVGLPTEIDWKPGENYRYIGGVKHYRSYEAYVED